MPSVYFMLLTFALGSIWIYTQTSNDIPFVLAGVIGLICLVWGFAFAHWSLQILIVLGLWRLYKVYMPEEVNLG